MKLFKSIINVLKAKDAEASEKLEEAHAVTLGKQDLEDMTKDLNTVINNLGNIKGTIKGLARDIDEKRKQIQDLEAKGTDLVNAGKDELALKVGAKIEALEAEIKIAETAKIQQENLCKQHEKNRETLLQKIEQAKSQQKMLETMDAVAKSNEVLVKIDPSGSSSAVQKFEQRMKKAQERLDATSAKLEVQEASAPDSLDKEINAALGTAPGSATLARFKAKEKS